MGGAGGGALLFHLAHVLGPKIYFWLQSRKIRVDFVTFYFQVKWEMGLGGFVRYPGYGSALPPKKTHRIQEKCSILGAGRLNAHPNPKPPPLSCTLFFFFIHILVQIS